MINDFSKSIDHRKSVRYFQNFLDLKHLIMSAYSNLGINMLLKGDYDKSMFYYDKNLKSQLNPG